MSGQRWITGKKAERILRRWEAEQLDPFYKSFEFYNQELPIAVYSLNAAFDSHHVTNRLIASMSHKAGATIGHMASIAQDWKAMQEGLVEAVRWLLPMDRTVPDAQPTINVSAIDAAGELLLYSSDYAKIAQFHVMYGRKLVDLLIDEDSKCVRFSKIGAKLPGTAQFDFVETMKLEEKERQEYTDELAHLQEMLRMHLMVSSGFRLSNGRIIVDDWKPLSAKVAHDLSDLVLPSSDIDLDPKTDLGGFSWAQWHRFWHALYRWSYLMLIQYEILADLDMPQEECMPTQVVGIHDFMTKMGHLSELDATTLQAITERITFDYRTRKPDIFLQPMLRGSYSFCWSPNVVCHSKFQRNILKLMARTEATTNVIATINGSREINFLLEICNFFEQPEHGGYKYKCNVKIGEESEIDILLWSPSAPSEVLLVDGKVFLPADDINELYSATAEMVKTQKKLTKDIERFKGMGNEQKKGLYDFVPWGAVRSYWGLIVTFSVSPHSGYDNSKIPAVTSSAIFELMDAEELSAPSRIWRAAKERRWIAEFSTYRHKKYLQLKINGIHYQLPLNTEAEEGASIIHSNEWPKRLLDD